MPLSGRETAHSCQQGMKGQEISCLDICSSLYIRAHLVQHVPFYGARVVEVYLGWVLSLLGRPPYHKKGSWEKLAAQPEAVAAGLRFVCVYTCVCRLDEKAFSPMAE